MARKRVKNKHELTPKSGVQPKPKIKQIVLFEFEINGKRYKNNEGRLKIATDGSISYYIKLEDKWQALKGQLIKLKAVEKKIVGYTKKTASRKRKKVTSGLSTSLQTK